MKQDNQPPSTFAGLRRIIAILRGPDGCPWDRVQTHQSLAPYLLEETHETLEPSILEIQESCAKNSVTCCSRYSFRCSSLKKRVTSV